MSIGYHCNNVVYILVLRLGHAWDIFNYMLEKKLMNKSAKMEKDDFPLLTHIFW